MGVEIVLVVAGKLLNAAQKCGTEQERKAISLDLSVDFFGNLYRVI